MQTVTFSPRNLLVAALFLVAFGSMLSVAADPGRGLAAGMLAVVAYLLIEVFTTFNPAVWTRDRSGR